MENKSWEEFLEEFDKTTDNLDRAHIGNYMAAFKKYVKREKFNPSTKK